VLIEGGLALTFTAARSPEKKKRPANEGLTGREL
jgi:hypothetical protein